MNRRTLTFALAGKPRGKGRPRFTNRGGYVKTYTDADTVAYEGGIARVARQALAGAPPLTGPLAAFVRVCVGVPASASKKAQAAMLAGETYPTKVPDLDNIIKGVPYLGSFPFHHFLRALYRSHITLCFKTVIDERFEQFERHLLRQTTLMEPQVRPYGDYRPPGIIHPLAEKILAESSLLTLQHVGQRS